MIVTVHPFSSSAGGRPGGQPPGAAVARPVPDTVAPSTVAPADESRLVVVLRDMTGADTVMTARWHQDHLRHGLFPALGQRFVQRWHRTFVEAPAGEAVLALDGTGAPLGFLVGATDQRAYVEQVLADHRLALVMRGAVGLLARPRLLVRFVRTRASRYTQRLVPLGLLARLRATGVPAAVVPAPPPVAPDRGEGPVAVIHAVVSAPYVRRSGSGRALVESFVDRARAAGAAHVEIVTDDGPDGAAAFYSRLGWEDLGSRPDKDGGTVRRFRMTW